MFGHALALLPLVLLVVNAWDLRLSAGVKAGIRHQSPSALRPVARRLPRRTECHVILRATAQPQDDDRPPEDDEDMVEMLSELTSAYSMASAPKARTRVELTWMVQAANDECYVEMPETCGDICTSCHGEGEVECRFCRGTGFFTIGDDLIGTNNDCPVCRGTGLEVGRPLTLSFGPMNFINSAFSPVRLSFLCPSHHFIHLSSRATTVQVPAALRNGLK